MEDSINLTDGQRYAIERALSGANLFITGKAGTGKTFVTKRIFEELTDSGRSVALCASTGIAALNLSEAVEEPATTVHSLLGIPIGCQNVISVDYPDRNFFSIKTNKVDIISNFDTVIIDEISMLRLDAFGRAMLVLDKAEKKKGKRIQRIVIGDFLQLPPVVTKNDRRGLSVLYDPDRMFAFDFSKAQMSGYDESDDRTHSMWQLQNFEGIELSDIIRQDDMKFARALSLIREGNSAPIDYMNYRATLEDNPEDDIVSLYPLKRDAEEFNSRKLEELVASGEKLEEHDAICLGNVDMSNFKEIPELPTLKIANGSRIMITVNSPQAEPDGYCNPCKYSNGSMGTYEGLDENKNMRIKLDNGEEIRLGMVSRDILGSWEVKNGIPNRRIIGTIKQYPVNLSWAMTIHKSQGLTLDKVFLSPGRIFTNGQLYVALSRLKNVDGLHLDEPLRPSMVRCDKRVKDIVS